jgi:hypothetical protein
MRRTPVTRAALFSWLPPSQSLSQHAVFVRGFHCGYRVWYVAR